MTLYSSFVIRQQNVCTCSGTWFNAPSNFWSVTIPDATRLAISDRERRAIRRVSFVEGPPAMRAAPRLLTFGGGFAVTVTRRKIYFSFLFGARNCDEFGLERWSNCRLNKARAGTESLFSICLLWCDGPNSLPGG